MSRATSASNSKNTITELTRREIRRAIIREGISWSGELNDVEFLNRLYDLCSLPTTDHRFDHAEADICQHRINNLDWDKNWVFSDERLQLAGGPDEILLQFLAEIAHPAVCEDREKAKAIIAMFNKILVHDGWELVERSTISGRSIYGPRRITSSQHTIRSTKSLAQQVDADYLHRQINRMESAIESDPELAIGTAKEMVETVCHTILESCGKPVTDRPDLLPLVRRALDELKLVPDGIKDDVKGAKSVKAILGNLSTLVQGLAELRNLYGTGHGKVGTTKGLTARHARLAVGSSTTLAIFLFDTYEDRRNSQ